MPKKKAKVAPENRYKKVKKTNVAVDSNKSNNPNIAVKIAPENRYKNVKKTNVAVDSNKSNNPTTSLLPNVSVVSPDKTNQRDGPTINNCKRNLHFSDADKDDDDDGFFCPEPKKIMNISSLKTIAVNMTEDSLDKDIFQQEKVHSTVVKAIPNIKVLNTNAYPSRVYVVRTKGNVMIGFCLMFRDINKCPASDNFWQMKLSTNPNEEGMKKAFKFNFICDLRSKESSLIAKPGGRKYNNTWKAIVRLQKIGHKLYDDEQLCQWGRHLAYFIDTLLLDGRYYTPYRFAGNLTPKEEKPLSYYITITEIFNILKLRYPLYSSNNVLEMLEQDNLVEDYFDDTSFKQAIQYVENKGIINDEENMNHSTTSNSNNGHTRVSMDTRKMMENLMKS